MDVLVELLCEFKFERLSSTIRPPVIIHCVPGAGKSSLIRELLRRDSRFVAYTRGIADKPNLSGAWIQAYPQAFPEGTLVVIDEYTLGPIPDNCFALFGDPLQANVIRPLRAHFVSKYSHRFGKCTAALLKELGFEVEASGEDVVQIRGIYETDPRDQVLYFEEEIGCLLRAHGVDAKHCREIIGQTFQSVTFVTSENSPKLNPVDAFQCLTRHRESLLILCPDATYTSA